jgi:hypothetical protein
MATAARRSSVIIAAYAAGLLSWPLLGFLARRLGKRFAAWRVRRRPPPPTPPLLMFLSEYPDLFKAEILERMDSTDRALLKQTAHGCRDAVMSSDLPIAGRIGAGGPHQKHISFSKPHLRFFLGPHHLLVFPAQLKHLCGI